ncbi:uracil DNA glycosylase [Arachnomyces sp. PD_36]|nr:uracil DNA glycosylase [Arachnomyces sp. PD_36]
MATPNNKRNASHLSSSTTDAKKPKANGSISAFFKPPKSSQGNSNAPPTVNFNKEKWVASLSPEKKELLQLEIDTLDESWLFHLKDEIVTNEFLNLKRFLQKEMSSNTKIFPPPEDIYSWSRHTPLHKVKAVIIGQDPYHNNNQAHGLCFSVRPPTNAPPSLVNMYTALKNDYPSFVPPPNKSGLLTPWADNGVLMLNTCLTVRAHTPNSHAKKGWEKFTQKVIDTVAKARTRGVVFLSWGNSAAQRVAKINKEKHAILQSVHPSPFSARNGFFTCGHFKKANEWLRQRYGDEGMIEWSLTPTNSVLKPAASTAGTSTDSSTTAKSKEGTSPAVSAPALPAAPPPKPDADDDFDDDDVDALEALAASEADGIPEPATLEEKGTETGAGTGTPKKEVNGESEGEKTP